VKQWTVSAPADVEGSRLHGGGEVAQEESMRVFICGASGVVGRPLIRILTGAGHEVTGTTRTASRAAAIEQMGATPVVVDAYDVLALTAVMMEARPDVLMHQLTDLPDVLDTTRVASIVEANRRVRSEGTANVVAAALAAGAKRLVAQSIAMVYVPGTPPYRETDPLQPTAAGEIALEEAVLGAPGIEGIVLRYGRWYGPGTWSVESDRRPVRVHVEAAAQAAHLAITRGAPGVYNIAEDDGEIDISKARLELGFDPDFRLHA
jgi:nucleoside-diphosphate-sugar epimerase